MFSISLSFFFFFGGGAYIRCTFGKGGGVGAVCTYWCEYPLV